MWVKDLEANEKNIKLTLLCKRSNTGYSTSGKSYLNITFMDKTGDVEAKLWDAKPEDITKIQKGNVYELIVNSILYQGNIQLKIVSYKQVVINKKEEMDNFLIYAPINVTEVWQNMYNLVQGFKNKEYSKVVCFLLEKYKKEFTASAAAVRNHHEVCGGLIWHTNSMLQNAINMSSVYKEENIDFELLYAGIILHDFGKIFEITPNPTSAFSFQGKLLGHISIMSNILYKEGELLGINKDSLTLLNHMILSSHGKLEYGSPIEPKTIESEILSHLDDLDAKINIVNKAISKLEINQNTPPLLANQKKIYINHFKKNNR